MPATDTRPPTTALAPINVEAVPIALEVFGHERLQLIKETIGRGFPSEAPMTDAELEFAALICQRAKVDPLVKPPQIYFIKRKDSKLGKYVMTAQGSIDFLRLLAQRSHQYAGQVGPYWCAEDGVWRDVWLSGEPPAAAKVGILRTGFREPVWSVATWSEWAQYEPTGWDERTRRYTGKKLAQFWEQKPAHMLAKTAEGMSLKRAFPQETNDFEIARADEEWRQQILAGGRRRYEEMFGTEDDADRLGFRPAPQPALNAAGRVVDVGTGEVLEEHAAVPDVEHQVEVYEDQEPAASEPEPAADACATPGCQNPVRDQRGQPLNDNQRDLMLQRFGQILCQSCRKKTPERPADQPLVL